MWSILAVVAASALSPAQSGTPAKPVCQKTAPEPAKTHKSVHARKLNELPNADMFLGVLRTVDGCSKPAIVRYDIGSAPKRR